MKISFIIPAYNEEKYIGKCLESIIKEASSSQIESEIIIVNNASTDRTKEVAMSFTNSQIKVRIVDEPQKGVNSARQTGFRVASGNLIAYIDADSQLTPNWIETALNKINKPTIVAVSGPAIFHDLPIATNLIIWVFYYLAYITYLVNRFILKSGSLALGANILIKKQALQKIGGPDTTFQFYGDDTDLAKRLSKVGGVIFTFKLPIYTSGRRLKKEGLITMGLKYQINYFWILLFKKPFSKSSIDVRSSEVFIKPPVTNIKRMNNFLLGAKAIIALLLLAFLFRSPTGIVMAKADTRMDKAFSNARHQFKKFHGKKYLPNF